MLKISRYNLPNNKYKRKDSKMRSVFLWIIALILFGSVFYFMSMGELDLEQFYRWEIIVSVALSIAIWLIFQWRKTMRLEKTNVPLQFLDD